MVSFVSLRSPRRMSSMSNKNGAWPKFASTTSPGVCSPTVGYNIACGWKGMQIEFQFADESISPSLNLPVNLRMLCPNCCHSLCRNMCLSPNWHRSRWHRWWWTLARTVSQSQTKRMSCHRHRDSHMIVCPSLHIKKGTLLSCYWMVVVVRFGFAKSEHIPGKRFDLKCCAVKPMPM